MRRIKLTGREATIVRAIGFSEPVPGAEILEYTHMEAEDVTDTLNGMLSAGFIESVPFCEQIDVITMPATTFEVNPAYAHQIKEAFHRR
ncbi:MAG TPA: helix-turn-helix domain-containing protein [Candidatus Acidoferrum sp.]|nr:helix-turn-helix domain-containing protein [Candidatus Acidoferrum sp.]